MLYCVEETLMHHKMNSTQTDLLSNSHIILGTGYSIHDANDNSILR